MGDARGDRARFVAVRRLGEAPKIFNNLYVAMVRSGEAGGVLESVLDRLAGNLERRWPCASGSSRP